MPYFKWVGVDRLGVTKKGKQAAHSPQELSELLFRRNVALLRCRPLYVVSALWPINARTKSDLFTRKAKLLRAGVLLPTVLKIVGQQSGNPILYDILCAVNNDIHHGISLGKALEKHHIVADPIVTVMLTAGNESGNIIHAVENVAIYFHKQHVFNKNIRAALAMPFLTLLFFIGISCFIFICIIPRFADMFSSLQQELPALTRTMIEVSNFIRSSAMVYLVIFLAIVAFCLYRYCISIGKQRWDSFVDHVPCIGKVMWQHHMCQALQALALLVNSGVPLVTGLAIVGQSVQHFSIKSTLASLHHDVASGQLLSAAMVTAENFLPEVIALIHVGEESGTLGQALESAALVYNDSLEEQLKRFVFFLQPIVIILLGLLVTTLILAVYLPIMQLSQAL